LVVKSCNQPCPWKLACSHHCTKACHSGKCTESCLVPVRITCKCKNLKSEIACHEAIRLRSARKAIDNTLLDCEDECYTKRAAKEAQRESAQRDQISKFVQPTPSDHHSSRSRKQAANKDIFSPVASSSASSSQPTKSYKPPISWKLTKKHKNILYACLFGAVVFLLGFLVYLDRSKSMPNRRMR
jgi:hypothetical protein